MAVGDTLSEVQVRILRAISKGTDVEGVAKTMNMAPVALGREIAKLQIGGYLGDDGKVTEKGSKVTEE